MRYTYKDIGRDISSNRASITTKIRWTAGIFQGWTPPIGLLEVPHAIFQRQTSEILVPVYLLTPETLEIIGQPPA